MLRIPKRFPKVKATAAGSLALIVGFFGSLSLLSLINDNIVQPEGQVLGTSNLRSVGEEANAATDTASDNKDQQKSWSPTEVSAPPEQRTSSTSTTTPSTASDGVVGGVTGVTPAPTVPSVPVIPTPDTPVVPDPPADDGNGDGDGGLLDPVIDVPGIPIL